MTRMLDVCAKAAQGVSWKAAFDHDPSDRSVVFVRAILVALRDISDDLADIGADYVGDCEGKEIPCTRSAWRAIIDAILEGK